MYLYKNIQTTWRKNKQSRKIRNLFKIRNLSNPLKPCSWYMYHQVWFWTDWKKLQKCKLSFIFCGINFDVLYRF